MQANKEAQGALRSYLEMKAPGYALLVDAPWGAGKTHFVRSVCEVDHNPDAVRYVSLNGVADETAFRRALLKESFQEELAKKGQVFGDLISKHLGLGNIGTIARDIVEEALVSRLPDTLIFDDIERSSIGPQILFGLINEYVEHKDKRVILVVHSEAHVQKDEFLKRKEKLVGRTISLDADFEAAFPSFLAATDEGRGKSYFNDHRLIAKSIFEQAGHHNLRLLRSSVRDCAMILDRVDDVLFDAKEPMARFVRTYLALAMALARGEISLAHLDQRDNWNIAVSSDVEDDLKALNELFKRHEGVDIYAHSGSILPKSLARLLFNKRYADRTALNDILKSTNQFVPQDENPLWKQILSWGKLGWNDLENSVSDGHAYLFETTPIAPSPYLQIAFSMLWIQELGGLTNSREILKEKILKRIKSLGDSGDIPPAKMGKHLGWDRRGRQFSFGGYVCDADRDLLDIMEIMPAVQLCAYKRNISKDVAGLLASFQTDLIKFLSDIGYAQDNMSYYDVPIFDLADMDGFAAATLRHLEAGRIDELGDVFEKVAGRHSNADEWQGEKRWFKALQEALRESAANRSKLARAQLELFFRWHWKFAELVDDRNESTRD